MIVVHIADVVLGILFWFVVSEFFMALFKVINPNISPRELVFFYGALSIIIGFIIVFYNQKFFEEG